jgi:hypothetical protein
VTGTATATPSYFPGVPIIPHTCGGASFGGLQIGVKYIKMNDLYGLEYKSYRPEVLRGFSARAGVSDARRLSAADVSAGMESLSILEERG